MTLQKMRRKQSKFIYDYLPYNTFNHAHCQLSGRIMALYHEEDERGREVDPGVPKNYLINRLHRRISKWPNDDEVRDDLTYAATQLVVPNGAGWHIYPRTFECDNCGCLTKFDRDDIEDSADAGVDARTVAVCENCGERLADRNQLPFVSVCECGGISELYVPECCGVGMEFLNPTTSMANWGWRCVNPDCSEGDNGGRNYRTFYSTPVHCPRGDCHNKEMSIINHTASKAFYPQVYNLINVQSRLDSLHDSERYRARIVSDYLRGPDGDTGPSDHEVRKEANDILGGGSALVTAEEDTADEAMDEARSRLSIDVDRHRDETQRWLQTSYDGDPTALAEELYEYLSVIPGLEYEPQDGIESETYQEMVVNDAEDTHIPLSVVKKYNDLREGLNYDEVRLIKNFPITTVTYGYTRIAPEPPGEQRDPAETDTDEEGRSGDNGEDTEEDERDVELNLFTRGEHAEPQLYVQTNDAEAVQVKLNPVIVLDWLETNGIIDRAMRPDDSDPEAVRRWFLQHVSRPSRYESLPEHGIQNSDEAVARHVYTLLNTNAHLFINAMGVLAGHQRESLVERILPHTLSFIVYKRPDTDFVLGSIYTLFEEQFDDFVGHLDELNDCSYDPVCRHDENGACEDCLYLAAISTENANHNLGRGTFFGGPFDGLDLTGFREI